MMRFQWEEEGISTEFDYGKLNISGDASYGFRPFQLMVASIAGCSASVFRKILAKQRIAFDDLQVTADVDRNPAVADRIETIRLHFIVKGSQLDEDKLSKNLELARRNCSMARSVENSITIEETLEAVESDS